MLYQVTVGKDLGMHIYYVEGDSQVLVFDHIWKEHKPDTAHDKITISCLAGQIEKAEGTHI